MTNYELMKNRIDNLERGLKVRKLKSSLKRFWKSRLIVLQLQLNEMTIEEAEKSI